MDGVIGLARGEEAGDVGLLVEVHPEAAHGVVHAGEDLHGMNAGIDADELLVDFQDAFELAVEGLAIDVGEVEIDHGLSVEAHVVFVHDLEDGAGGDVARDQVAVLRVPLFEEVPAFGVGDGTRIALVVFVAGHPDAAAFAARGLGHEAEFIVAGNAGGMDLDELAVGVVRALLVERRLRRASADHRVGGLAEDGPDAAGADDDRVRGEGAHLHRAQVQSADAAADAVGIEHGGEELPALVLFDLAVGLVAADLLVERVEQLLAGGCPGEGRALVERAPEAAEVEQALVGAVEGDAHAVEQVDDGWGARGHVADRGLVGEEVAAVDGVVEVLVDGVSLALEVLGGVDAALGADRVRALDRHDGKEVDGAAGFGNLDDGGETGEASSYDDDAGCGHISFPNPDYKFNRPKTSQ